jgi:hypothetical protein
MQFMAVLEPRKRNAFSGLGNLLISNMFNNYPSALMHHGIPAALHCMQEEHGSHYVLQAEAGLRAMRDEGHQRRNYRPQMEEIL